MVLNKFTYSSDNYPEVKWLGYMVVLFLIFWETSILFSIVAVPIYIPTNSGQGFPFLHILANTYFLSFVENNYSNRLWGDISLWFWFAFTKIISDVEHLSVNTCRSSLEKYLQLTLEQSRGLGCQPSDTVTFANNCLVSSLYPWFCICGFNQSWIV